MCFEGDCWNRCVYLATVARDLVSLLSHSWYRSYDPIKCQSLRPVVGTAVLYVCHAAVRPCSQLINTINSVVVGDCLLNRTGADASWGEGEGGGRGKREKEEKRTSALY